MLQIEVGDQVFTNRKLGPRGWNSPVHNLAYHHALRFYGRRSPEFHGLYVYKPLLLRAFNSQTILHAQFFIIPLSLKHLWVQWNFPSQSHFELENTCQVWEIPRPRKSWRVHRAIFFRPRANSRRRRKRRRWQVRFSVNHSLNLVFMLHKIYNCTESGLLEK